MDYSLDIEELKEIPFDKYQKDFSFIVNGKEFSTNRFLADLLSPIIRRAHYQDSSINTFSISNEDIDIDKEELTEHPLETYFSDFLSLCNYSKITIDDTRQKYYSSYFYALGNSKEYFRLRRKYFEGITIDNVIKKIQIISKIESRFLGCPRFEGYSPLIDLYSENFEEIDQEEMKKLPLENLEEIIKNEKLQIENEDSLMDFVLNLYKSDRNNSSMIEFVIFRNLSNEMIEKFIGLFEIEDLDQKTWESICMRLKQSVSEDETVKDKRYISKGNLIEFKLDSNNKFNGILKYLTDKTGGNIIDNGTVSITSNSANVPVKNLVIFNNEDYFQYTDKSMANVLFDFKDRSVKLNKYSIHTGTYQENNGHLRNWAIEVSNDGEKWEEIDNRSNDSSLNGCRYSATFDVQKQRNKFYRFVRLRQTGLAWCPSSSNRFEIMYIDFYGFLKEPSSK